MSDPTDPRPTGSPQSVESTQPTEPIEPIEPAAPRPELAYAAAPVRRVQVAHLMCGLLFLGIVLVWLLRSHGVIRNDALPLLAPSLLILAGVAGLAASMFNARRRSSTDVGTRSGGDLP